MNHDHEIRRIAKQLEKLATDQAKKERLLNNAALVRKATSDTYGWVTEHTKTYNEHWQEEGRPSPYEPFPREEYFRDMFELFDLERIVFIEKSRDLMVSWACVAYFTLHAMRVPERGVLFQTQKAAKVVQLINYAKCLYEHQDECVKAAFPLSKAMRAQPADSLTFAHGGYLKGLPGGADQIRSYHPWGYLLDEASFVVEAGECYNQALSAAKGKIILNSSAGPGWYADVRHDVIRNAED
jgi:hypothetical protein